MSDNITKRVGLGTAYGFAKAGGYEGTVEEFTELLGNIAIDLARIENLSVTVTTLPAGSQATASLNGSVLSLGIPKGDKGDKGNTGDTGAPAGFGTVSATVDDAIGTPSVEVTASGADTAKNFAFAFHNLKGQKGDKGDTGEVSEAELTQAFEDFSANGTVANAEQLTTDIRANDQTPYLFRTAGGSVDIGDREYINGIVGGTVAWNQLCNVRKNYSTSNNGVSLTTDADGKITIVVSSGRTTAADFILTLSEIPAVANHVYAVGETTGALDSYYGYSLGTYFTSFNNVINNQFKIAKPTTAGRILVFFVGTNVPAGTYHLCYQTFDLTLALGSTIADYIYSLEQATAGAGVAFFKSLFPKPYYAYNSGELKSVKGLVSHDMVGFNAWDEEWEVGDLNTSNGANYPDPNRIRSKNYIRVLPSTAYYFKCPNNASYCFYDADKKFVNTADHTLVANHTFSTTDRVHYMRIAVSTTYGTTYKNDICINLSWDGSRNGEYEPYQKWSYPLDSDLELRGVPKIENGNLYYDGDVYESDGTVTRKYGIVDLGTLNWNKTTQSDVVVFYCTLDNGIQNEAQSVCSKYPTVTQQSDFLSSDKVGRHYGSSEYSFSRFAIHDSTYDNADATAFKSAMSGVYLLYELQTPTTETADPYTSPQIVSDFGTEEYVIDDDVFAIPVGHNTDYPVDLKAKLEMAPNSPPGDGMYVVKQTSGTNEYVPLIIPSGIPPVPTENGSYTLTATVSGGTTTLSWS